MSSILLFEEAGENLKIGFLANKLLQILDRDGPVTEKECSIIQSGIVFLKQAETGHKQVTTGKLTRDAVEASDAYARAIFAYNQMDEGKKKKSFEELLKGVLTELQTIEKSRQTKAKNNALSIPFFSFLVDYSINQLSEEQFKNRFEGREWKPIIL
ncbi:MAG: hypothetical protein K9W42_00080 [Candidatus Heimdallarchaeota archaeon]|nr:hypothetical protein [Candidatus Heimdallarchaeota archaeon]